MIQPKLWAQLGNQAFMCSCAIAHALKMNTTYSIPKKTISPNTWRTYFSHLPETKSATLHYYKEKRHCYDPLPEVDSLTIEGYWQSEKYWHGYKEQIAEALGFVFASGEYVSIHCRRGDYLLYPDQFPVMQMDYYYQAIEYFRSKGYFKFRVHSDDIPFCKTQINSTYIKDIEVEYSNIRDPLEDMMSMYNAAGFILANSTFGLFAALLRNDNPIVIAPADDRWFGPKAKHLETCDLMPERFIKM
jgi:hypothetical protein